MSVTLTSSATAYRKLHTIKRIKNIYFSSELNWVVVIVILLYKHTCILFFKFSS
jgi:hypothetical protein